MSNLHTIISSATIGAALALSVAGCALDDASPQETEYLFGLSEAELLQIHEVAPAHIDSQTWLHMNRAPFRCVEFGTLCNDIGEEAAYRIIEDGYFMALEGASGPEIAAHQWQAIAAAEALWEANPTGQDAFKVSNTRHYYDAGNNNKRLKVVAKAIELWPSGDFKSVGYCKTQKKVLGVWGVMNVDSLSGTRQAIFGGANGYTSTVNRSVTNDNRVDFPDRTDTAADLRTIVDCTASDGAWGASGSAEAYAS